MALLDRLKGRVETDLTDLELETMLDQTVAEIEARYGVIGSITILLDGRRRFLSVHRPIDETQSITVVEISVAFAGAVANETTMSADDYRIQNGGRILERLIDGTNGASDWARTIRLSYTPISDQPQRDEVAIRVVMADVGRSGGGGLAAERKGDWAVTYRDSATSERATLINSLAPTGRMMMA